MIARPKYRTHSLNFLPAATCPSLDCLPERQAQIGIIDQSVQLSAKV